MNETLVRAEHLHRSYRTSDSEIVALRDATCCISAGARIAVTGPSGSGKSTLIQIIAGIDTETSGSIAWPGLGAKGGLRPSKIGMVFQNESLLPPLTALENVQVPLLLQGTQPEDARSAAREALERIGLSDVADKLPEELSGGQAQRIAFARALITAPRLILADEPTGQLDRATAHHFFDVLLQSLAKTDTALVIATHDASIAQRMHVTWRMQHGALETDS